MRLLIIEDDELLLQNLGFLLGAEKDIELVGTVTTAEKGLKCLKEKGPDIILLDMELPGMHGIEFIRRAKALDPDVEILVHTVFADRETVFSAIKAGACGYILKGTPPRELMDALYSQYEGAVPMSPQIARAVIREFQKEVRDHSPRLSKKEREILQYIEKGHTYREIGKLCNISPNTVHTHIKKIYNKLHAKNRDEALLKAKRKGLI